MKKTTKNYVIYIINIPKMNFEIYFVMRKENSI